MASGKLYAGHTKHIISAFERIWQPIAHSKSTTVGTRSYTSHGEGILRNVGLHEGPGKCNNRQSPAVLARPTWRLICNLGPPITIKIMSDPMLQILSKCII